MDATFAAFGIDATYAPIGGRRIPVRVNLKRSKPIAAFDAKRIHAETATFELRASELAKQHPGDHLEGGGETYVIDRAGAARSRPADVDAG